MRVRHALEMDDCSLCMAAALAHAEAQGWLVTVAIVDDNGTPLQLVRMDEASPASVEGAIQKARSAGLIGIDTRIQEAMVKERPGIATMGRVAVEGGVPIRYEGQRVGGIGVSGVLSHQDAEVAGAGLEALLASWTG